MLISQTALAQLWACSFLVGILFGGVWDLLRIPRVWLGESSLIKGYDRLRMKPLRYLKQRTERKSSRALPMLRFLEDFGFCLAVGITMILLFYQINRGNIRIPAFICAFGGFCLYRVTIGKAISPILAYLAFGIETFFRYLFFLIGLPVRLPIRFLCKMILRFYHRSRNAGLHRARVRQTRRFWIALAKNGSGLLPTESKEVK